LAWDFLNEQILRIWREHFPKGREGGVLAPLFYPDHGAPELLFIGLNPSFNERETRKRAPIGVDVSEFYQWREFTADRMRIMQAVQLQFLQDFAYFKPMREIARYVEMTWAHLDLYPLRETKQGRTIAFLNDHEALRNGLDRLFQETIQRIRPKIIVVVNAYASQCFYRLFPNLLFDEMVGFDRLDVEGEEAAVFFSGMLTGQRALDTGSLRRLRWHVRRAAELARRTVPDRSRHMSWGAGDVELL